MWNLTFWNPLKQIRPQRLKNRVYLVTRPLDCIWKNSCTPQLHGGWLVEQWAFEGTQAWDFIPSPPFFGIILRLGCSRSSVSTFPNFCFIQLGVIISFRSLCADPDNGHAHSAPTRMVRRSEEPINSSLFGKMDTTNHYHPRREIMPKKGGGGI